MEESKRTGEEVRGRRKRRRTSERRCMQKNVGRNRGEKIEKKLNNEHDLLEYSLV